MGAGARLAAERDRWPEHWRVADLELEEDQLLELLESAEELRAVIPAMRSTPFRGDEQVLLAVTDRRVLLIGRVWRVADSPLGALDVTSCAASAPRGERIVPHDDGHLAFDIDDEVVAHLWTSIDRVDRLTPISD